jgi:hypothetical protein
VQSISRLPRGAMRVMPPVTVLAALALFACGPANNGSAAVPTPTPLSPPTQALLGWTTFPAGQAPRPVVLVGNNSPTAGFANNEDAKNAAICHKMTTAITPSNAVPPPANVTWSSGAKASYPSISAATALAAMMQTARGASSPFCAGVQPLVATAVRWGAYELPTDRGRAQIDSWLFTMSRMSGEIAYPALAPSAVWNADMSKASATQGSTLSADGLTLTFSFAGAVASGPCGSDYRGIVAESQMAVAVALQETPHSAPNANIACQAIAQIRHVDVSLASPLGGRVVLDATGNFAPVCPVAKPDC